MLRYTIRRTLALVPALALVAVLTFLVIHIVPGDPAGAMLGTEATPERIAQLRQQLGLDKPLLRQFAEWAVRAMQGDLGQSFYLRQPVTESLMERLPLSLTLATLALVVSLAIGIPAGIVAAIFRNRAADAGVMAVAVLGISFPSFWLGLNFIYLFGVLLRWFPTGGYVPLTENLGAGLRHLCLPSVSLGILQAALIARITRSSMLEVLQQDYVRTARAQGLSEFRVVARHALRNAMIPIITVVGLSFGILLGGAVIVETVFTLPGIGRLVINAVARRDYPIIQGALLLAATSYILVNLAVDLLYAYFDPRIREHYAGAR